MKKQCFHIALLFLVLLSINKNLIAKDTSDSIPNIIKSWKIDTEYWDIDTLLFDTLLNGFQNDDRIIEGNYLPVWLGNYGLAYQNIEIENRTSRNPFKYYLGRQLFSSDRTKYFNTRKPITQVEYFNGGSKNSKNQIVRVLHTQNINPYFNAGFKIRFLHSLGNYANQESKNTSVKFWSSYEKENYFLFTSLDYNKLKNFESGGLENDSSFVSNNFSDAKYLPVWLNSSQVSNRFSDFMLVQGIKFIKNGHDTLRTKKYNEITRNFKLMHRISISNYNRIYSDNSPSSGYYNNIFIDSISTYDSISFIDMQNSIFIRYQNSTGNKTIDVGIKHLYEKYYCFSNEQGVNSIGIYSRMKGIILNNIKWNFQGESFLSGLYKGDYNLSGNIKYSLNKDSISPLIEINVNMNRNTNSWFYSNFLSNNFIWQEEFLPSSLKQFSVRFIDSKRRFTAKSKIGLISNLVYFDNSAIPSQLDSNIQFYSIKVEKEFHIKKVWFDNGILIQGVSKPDVYPVPFLSLYSNLFYENYALKKVLLIQLGIGVQYQSEYYSQAYMPATGVFYLQKESKIGNYPFVNVFFNVKLKQVRFSFKYAHINQGLLGNYYFSTLHYPAPPRQFTFGLSWLFSN